MNPISGVQLLKLCKTENLDFIAFTITPWHAISTDASIAYLRSTYNPTMRGAVMVIEHPESGLCVNDKHFNQIGYDVYCPAQNNYFGNSSKSFWIRLKQVLYNRWEHFAYYMYVLFGGINWFRLPMTYVINPVFPRPDIGLSLFRLGRFAKFVTSDEGVGSYLYFEEEESPTTIGEWFRYVRKSVVGHRLMSKCHKIIPTTLFIKHGSKISPNASVIPFYRKVLSGNMAHYDTSSMELDNSILVCTSMREGDKFEDNADVELWTEICTKLSADKYHMILKPHPRDEYFAQFAASWHCDMVPNKRIPLEALCCKAHPRCVIGLASTALITAKILYNVPVICISHIFDMSLRSEEMVKSVKLFAELFTDIIYFPQSVDELVEYVKRIE